MNDRIRVPEIRVIGADGKMLGVMNTDEARRTARDLDLDLVEVNPKATPPVCKIMDFGKFKYEEKKKQADARKRQSQIALKEIKLRPKTDDHDLEFKMKHIRRFLEEGNKVKITVRFRGREITHPETAQRQIDLIVKAVEDIGAVETSARLEGRTMTAILAPRVKVQPARSAGADTDAGADAGTDTGTDTGAGTDTDTDAGTDTGADADTGAGADADTGTGADAER